MAMARERSGPAHAHYFTHTHGQLVLDSVCTARMSILKYFQKVGESSTAASNTASENVDELEDMNSDSGGDTIEEGDNDRSSERDPANTELSCEVTSGDDSKSLASGTSPSYDVANYVKAASYISDAEKYQAFVNHFKPDPNYVFPRGDHRRTFQYRWLQLYPWLAYSKQKNGGFCLPCIFFSTFGYHHSNPGVLVQRPLTSFAKALELLRKHAAKDYHKIAEVRADEFLKVMRNRQPNIRCQISEAVTKTISKNRKVLGSIVRTIELCGRQNIALRGHCDNATEKQLRKPW